ncbi:ankyrin repeat and SOCS box protein 17 [Discoglossus pictus]
MAQFYSLNFDICCFTRKNIFIDLIESIVRKPSVQFLGQWGYQCYERRIYRILAKILRNIDLNDFDNLITDYISFVKKSEHRLYKYLNKEFVDICGNTILYWIFARKGDPSFVDLLLQKTKHYLQDESSSLALVYRTFTPVYCPDPPRGITPLVYVAQTRHATILKLLLQYGILEKEKSPFSIVFRILFYPSRVRIMGDHDVIDLHEDAKTCLQLCVRVLSFIPVADIEKQLSFGRHPIISNWQEYIPPTRNKEPCELVHLCRMSIRSQLIRKNMLPDGIFSLPIPVTLQRYLNLDI